MGSDRVLILLIALSLAMLPASGGVALSVKSPIMSLSEAVCDCCDQQAMPCQKAADGCKSMETCGFECFSFGAIAFSTSEFVLVLGHMDPSFASTEFRSHMGHPPFRPPRA